MGYVGQKDGVLLARRLQLGEYALIPLSLGAPPLDPVPREGRPAGRHNSAEPQAEKLLGLHLSGNCMEDQPVVQQLQGVQGDNRIQNPLFIQDKQRENQDAGHGGDVWQAGLMHAEEKELRQQQTGAQVLKKRVRAGPRNVQEPREEAARRHQRDHPELPRHDNGDQNQHCAERRRHDGQQQMPACLRLRPHCFSNSWDTRLSSSWGSKGFTR